MPAKTYMFVEAVAILPISEPVPDEWFPVLLAAELQRELELLELPNNFVEYYRKPIKQTSNGSNI